MIINIDTTQELSELDLRVLRALAGEEAVSKPKTAAAPTPKAKAAPAPEKAAPKAEEPEEEEAAADEDAVTLDDAVAIATKLVSSGEAAKVKAALSELGAKRVSELSGDKIAKFVTALS